MIELREITDGNRLEVLALSVGPHQQQFVGSVAEALEEAEDIPGGNAWIRADCSKGESSRVRDVELER